MYSCRLPLISAHLPPRRTRAFPLFLSPRSTRRATPSRLLPGGVGPFLALLRFSPVKKETSLLAWFAIPLRPNLCWHTIYFGFVWRSHSPARRIYGFEIGRWGARCRRRSPLLCSPSGRSQRPVFRLLRGRTNDVWPGEWPSGTLCYWSVYILDWLMPWTLSLSFCA